MRRVLLSTLTILTLIGCVAHEHEHEHDRRDGRPEAAYRDRDGHPYRHARWHDEDVYRREDGHWYSRRGDEWVIRPEIAIE